MTDDLHLGRADGLEEAPRRALVGDLGEFGLISRLARILSDDDSDPLRPPAAGEIGIGDDAALWEPAFGKCEVLTTDALVDSIHFRLATTGWRDLGWKALSVNVSDIAAMAARPRRAFVTIGVPRDTAVDDLEELYEGIRELAEEHDIQIAGGDTVSSPVVFLSVAVVGTVMGQTLRRSTGRDGDVLAVTGVLGGSAGGLALLERGSSDPRDDDDRSLIEAHRRPKARVAEAELIASAGVECGMDLSDGLIGDAERLSHASGLSATIDLHQVPISPALERRFGTRARAMAISGGEDYELLVAAPAYTVRQASKLLQRAGFGRLTEVGRLSLGAPGKIEVLDDFGRVVTTELRSWEHFGISET